MSQTPLLVVVAGPNGAGKSTTAPQLLRGALSVDEFVNADAIASGLSYFLPESVAIAAGRAMLTRMNELSALRKDFAFETTLASRSFAPRVVALRSGGYRAHMAFLALASPDLAVARVDDRVRRGGHSVPEPVIRRRFVRGLHNFFTLYLPLLDSWQLLDNSVLDGPRLVAQGDGELLTIADEGFWQHLRGFIT